MSTNVEFDLKHRSRALTEGPSRAAARAYLKGIGYDDEALSKPIIGVASTWIETMPCNFHLRALSAGSRTGSATPAARRWSSTPSRSPTGSRWAPAACARASCRARSSRTPSSSSPAGICFDGVVALSGCDKTIPGTVMALARLDLPGVMLYGGSIPPGQLPRPRRVDHGRLRGHRRALARQDERRGPRRDRGGRQPRRRRLRRPVHRQHDGDGVRGHGHLADRLRDGPRAGRDEGRVGLRVRQARHGRPASAA